MSYRFSLIRSEEFIQLESIKTSIENSKQKRKKKMDFKKNFLVVVFIGAADTVAVKMFKSFNRKWHVIEK